MEHKGDTYVLTRETHSSIRLTAQHFLWQRELGWNLHPTIAKHLQDAGTGASVAEIACGNGLWMVEESANHPRAHFTGFDISDAFFPRQENWPSNVQFEKLDAAAAAVPERLQGGFDVVHCRLMLGAIRDGNADPWIETFLALLKPGGYLQWDELHGVRQWTSSNGAADPKWNTFGTSMMKKRVPDSSFEWIAARSETLARHGMVDISQINVDKPSPALRKHWTDNEFAIMEDMATSMRLGEEVLQELADGKKQGFDWFSPLRVVIARKAP
ncbi:uncharacterized protein AB675_538 [Cyphellophora attinorum]|uniref:Methyltransferase type 12 domain-containing protein n=1 Tax=Cyphellophora attinorum TaxID=1664694 RepID=A0A0N1HHW2_9EURO|nr:uncharacterized protein AB675_538 [Phialophora attinorum]KPI45733.1 hypothetical protein AB675_538 [Phialophora attinorum]